MVNETRIPAGYKKTEVGIIPEKWETKKLGQIADINTDNLMNNTDANYSFTYVSLEDVQQGLLKSFTECIFYSAPSRARRRVQKSDALFGTVRPNLKSHLFIKNDVKDFICSTGFAVIRNKKNDAKAEYIYYHLFGNVIERQINALLIGSNYPSINCKEIKSLTIPLPPLPEQEAIVQVLSDMDALITALDRLIVKKRNIKQGAMQQLLTGQKRLPGFTGKWETKKLGDVSPLQRGFDLPNKELKKGDYPVVYSNGIINNHDTYKVKSPGVVTGRSGTIGKVTFVEKNYWPHNTTLWVTDFKGNIPKYIYFLYIYVKLERYATGSGVPTLNRNDVHSFQIPLPPLLEQEAIAQVLSDMDAELEALEKKRDKYKAVKNGMMHQLLTGKTRLGLR